MSSLAERLAAARRQAEQAAQGDRPRPRRTRHGAAPKGAAPGGTAADPGNGPAPPGRRTGHGVRRLPPRPTATARPPRVAVARRPRPPSRRPRAAAASTEQERLDELKGHVHTELVKQLGPHLYAADVDQADLESRVRQVLGDVLSRQDRPISNADRASGSRRRSATTSWATARSSPSSATSDVSEVMVNAYDQIYLEKDGRLQPVKAQFTDEAHLRRTIDKIVSRIGRRVDESSPMVDARLPDGSRVNAVIPPLAIDGSCLTIRKFATDPLTVHNLIDFGIHLGEDRRLPRRLRARPPEHHRLRQHRRRQDDHAERAVVVHPERRAHRHHRGRRRAPAQAGPRRPPGVAPGQHRGQGRGHHPRPGEELAAYAPRPHHRR